MILGIDEVGRGPWAGPLVVGAVVLGQAKIEGLTDSKKLSKKRREQLDVEIREKASGIGLGWVSAHEIDEIGLSMSLELATKRAVEQVKCAYHEIIIDGTINFLKDTSKGNYVTTLAKADLLVPCVSAASIVAKVARDNYMSDQDLVYSGYEFKSHAGYGTAKHREAIAKLGVSPLHRLSFAPLAKYRTINDVSIDEATTITTKQIGDTAEGAVAEYLILHGHTILARNWRTKLCEIDIVSLKDQRVFFTEVKYRRSAIWGDGLAAITPKKLSQMRFAAELFITTNPRYANHHLNLQAASVSGDDFTIDEVIELN